MLWLLVSLRLKPSEEANETMECASLPFVVARLRLAKKNQNDLMKVLS